MKKQAELFLKATHVALMDTGGKLPEGAVGSGRVIAHGGKTVTIEFADATIKSEYDGDALPYNTKLYFDATGKVVSMVKPEVKPATTRGNTGAAKIPAVKTLY